MNFAHFEQMVSILRPPRHPKLTKIKSDQGAGGVPCRMPAVTAEPVIQLLDNETLGAPANYHEDESPGQPRFASRTDTFVDRPQHRE
jgi:hypothetical protein